MRATSLFARTPLAQGITVLIPHTYSKWNTESEGPIQLEQGQEQHMETLKREQRGHRRNGLHAFVTGNPGDAELASVSVGMSLVFNTVSDLRYSPVFVRPSNDAK
jgi:hypothetical protein